MAKCYFIDTCPFLNDKMINMPITTNKLVERYCAKDFTMCKIHKVAMIHGIDMVLINVSPNDWYELTDRLIELVLWGKFGG